MTTTTKSIEKEKKLTTRAKIYIARGVIATTLFGTYFFLISGRMDYDRGWITYIYLLIVILSINLFYRFCHKVHEIYVYCSPWRQGIVSSEVVVLFHSCC